MSLQVHTIHPSKGAAHKPKRVGRGNASGHGNYSCRGGKGQTARSGGGAGLRAKAFKAQMQQTPKLRGFHSLREKPSEVTLEKLENNFVDGEIVTLVSLRDKGLISKNAASAKILSCGSFSKKITVQDVLLTKSASEKIKAAGGEVK